MGDIFNSWLAMDCFCYDIAEAWIKNQKSKRKPYDVDSYLEWLEEFMCNLDSAFNECIEDENDEEEA